MNFSEWFQEHLQVGADGFVWSTEQVPEARRYVEPPKGLGEWSVTRHVFHMLYYEQSIALPSMQQWLGGILPVIEDSDEDVAWNKNKESIENLLIQFRKVRAEQISLLPKFEDEIWNETRKAVWGTVTLLWVVSKTFQHTAEHTNNVMQMRLWWDDFLAS